MGYRAELQRLIKQGQTTRNPLVSQYTAPDEIPVLRGKSVIQRISAAVALAYPTKYVVKFSGGNKARPVYARLRERMTPWTPLSNNGVGFRQMLDAGPVWALKGTPGSHKPAEVVS